jgi:uncharacterized membrane protein YccF (DUF307 family)
MMRLIGNIIWILAGGIITCAAWLILGLLLCITVIGIPFGIQCFKFAKINLAPFGKDVTLRFFEHPIMNLLWAIFFGWELALAYLASGIISCITVIGIPFGLQAFKFMKLALFPFGADVHKM